jgi:hypothetical protein
VKNTRLLHRAYYHCDVWCRDADRILGCRCCFRLPKTAYAAQFWEYLWFIPAGISGFCLVLFALFFKEEKAVPDMKAS